MAPLITKTSSVVKSVFRRRRPKIGATPGTLVIPTSITTAPFFTISAVRNSGFSQRSYHNIRFLRKGFYVLRTTVTKCYRTIARIGFPGQ